MGNETRQYVLYAHFGQAAAEALTNERIADALADNLRALGATRADLLTFLNARYRLVECEDIDSHEGNTRTALKNALGGTAAETQVLFYPRALSEAFRLASQPNIIDRTTTRTAFLAVVNQREMVFRELLARLRGGKALVRHTREELDRADMLLATHWVVLRLGRSTTQSLSAEAFGELIESLARCRFREKHHLRTAKPLTIVHEETTERATAAKRWLVQRGIGFLDGHEDLSFSMEEFDAPPMVERRRINNRLTEVIERASYSVRLVSAATLAQHWNDFKTCQTVLSVGTDDQSPQWRSAVRSARISSITDPLHLVDILKRGPSNA
jgi:hypothetical protein